MARFPIDSQGFAPLPRGNNWYHPPVQYLMHAQHPMQKLGPRYIALALLYNGWKRDMLNSSVNTIKGREGADTAFIVRVGGLRLGNEISTDGQQSSTSHHFGHERMRCEGLFAALKEIEG